MQIATFVRWDSSIRVVERHVCEYSGTVALCKGDTTAKAAEQQQLAFNEQLMQVFQAQFSGQHAALDFLNSVLKPIATNPTGYGAPTLAAMRTGATDTISTNYASAQQAIQQKQAQQGGAGLPSGVNSQILAGLAQGQASDTAKAQQAITIADANLKQTNFWNAIQGLSGTAQMMNPVPYAGAANQGGETVANLSTAYTNSQQSGWLNALLGGLGGVAGAWASGGFKMPGTAAPQVNT